jgi:hypothetical protein
MIRRFLPALGFVCATFGYITANSAADGGPLPVTAIAAPTDGSDAAPAIQAAIVSNAHLVLPAGTYTLCSYGNPGPYPATGPAAVYVHNVSNFVLDLSAATIQMCNASSAGAGPSYFMFDTDSNYAVIGGTFVGNLSGRTGNGNTVGIQSFNDVNFRYSGQVFNGDWQSTAGGGVAYDGDFDVNGIFENAQMKNVAICFDFGFIENVTFKNFTATGKYLGSSGNDCLDILYDVQNVGSNKTGHAIDDSHNVTVTGGRVTGFNTGWVLSSGTGYNFRDNHWYGNAGTASVKGLGGLISYNASGNFSSVGHPVQNVSIIGDHYDNNGNAKVGGSGIEIDTAAMTGNGDLITGIHIKASFTGNYTVGVYQTVASPYLKDASVDADCSGANQATCVGNIEPRAPSAPKGRR